MKFDDYHFAPEILKGIKFLGFKRPTDIQYKAIPSILKGEDVLAVAQTGTGKTAAFAIPLLNMLHEQKIKARRPDGVKCIIMTPTHELALQTAEVFDSIGKYSKVNVLALIGGVDQQPQIDQLEKRVDILVATPGRMFDLMSQGHLKVNRVEKLVLDEADHMLDLGFIDDIRDLTQRLPRKRQTLFFSATINQKIKKLAYSLIRQSAIRIQFSPKDPVSKNVSHAKVFIDMDDKRFFLERLINEQEESKFLVFVRTIVRAERVAKAMDRVGIDTLTIHREKDQRERNDVLEKFKNGDVNVLIATDITARGIDIPDVEYVINYDLPEQAENYVHRVGRTGRGKKKGQAVSFCSPWEKEILAQIEEYLGKPIETLTYSKEDYEETVLLSKEKTSNLDELAKMVEELENSSKKKKRK